MPRSICTVLLLCAAATAVAGCTQATGLMNAVQDAKFHAPSNPFKLPEWSEHDSDNVSLGPKGPVAADDLISPSGTCAPKAEAAAPAPAPAPKPVQAAAPPDGLQPEGLGAAAPAPEMQIPAGGVALGMSECAVARRLGTPNNVSISAGPQGQRRVVLTYLQGDRPGLYSFESGRLKE
ncbi:MAG TPA: hypothetical protein VE224_09145, partial [Pseudolabrys sp.]|nr:hypothetical protein [Pseudolabrys sp.]